MSIAMTTQLSQGGNPAVYRFVGSNAVKLGNDFSGEIAETWPTRADGRPSNRETEFLGDRYVWHANKIRKFDGTNWNVAYTLSPGMDSLHTGCHTGLHVANVNGAPMLIGVYTNTTNNLTYYVRYDGTTWFEGSTGYVNNLNAPPRCMLWRNILYIFGAWATSTGTQFEVTYDPLTDTIAHIGNQGTGKQITANSMDYCVWKNKLFQVGFDANGATAYLSIFQRFSGFYSNVLSLYSGANENTAGSSHGLFVDGNYMYAIAYTSNGGGGGFQCYEIAIDGSGNLSVNANITSTVIPAGFRFSGYSTGQRVFINIFQDQVSNPGGAVNTWIFIALDNSESQPWALYKWMGPGSQLELQAPGSVGLTGMATPHSKEGGGNRLYRPGQLTIDELSLSAISTGIRISFKAFGNAQANVQFYFTTSGGIPLSLCSLSNPSNGTVSGTNLLQDVDADGTTTHTVDWPYRLDGVTADDFVEVVPRIFN